MAFSQVNYALAVGAVTFAIACAPAGTKSAGTETTTVASAQTPAPPPGAPQDTNVTLADQARVDGRESAPLWVIIVSDFQCPYCKQWHEQTYPAFHDEFVKSGKVRVAYVNYPLNSHPQAWPSSEAAMCAGAQGKFWQMHDAILDTQQQWASSAAPAAVFDSLAGRVGVDMPRWRSCITAGTMKPIIRADYERASAAGVRSTPTFLIGDELLAGAHPIASFRRVIDSALVKARPTAR